MSPLRRIVASVAFVALLSLAACSDRAHNIIDSGMDAPAHDTMPTDTQDTIGPGTCRVDNDCDDGMFCNGMERCLAGRCVPGVNPCDDHASCTTDSCDDTMGRCTHVPDDTMCGDGNACDGIERCAPGTPGVMSGTGCQIPHPENFVDCDDSNTCTIDTCDMTVGCVHSPRDLDGDGFVDRMCTVDGTPTGMPGNDCDDSDPTVHPGSTEICDDNKDNDCNGLVDFTDPTCHPHNDSCATIRMLPGSGTYWGSNVGLGHNFPGHPSCDPLTNVATSVYAFTLLAPSDVRVSMGDTTNGTAIALGSPCDPTMFSEIACSRAIAPTGFPPMGTSPNVFVRSLPAGTYTILIATPVTGAYQFTLHIGAGTTPPPGDGCPPTAPSVDVSDGMPQMLNTATLDDTIPVACYTGTPHPSGVFHLHLDTPRNVDLNVSSLAGTNSVSIRQSPCPGGTELRCLTAATVTTSIRNMAAGDYYIIVENSTASTVTVSATTSDPAVRVVGDACVNPANVGLGATFPSSGTATVDFSTLLQGADSGTSCGSGTMPDPWRDAIYEYTLAATSDVTINITPTGSWSPSYRWALESTCGDRTSTIGSCNSVPGSTASTRILGQAAGNYFLVLETNVTPPAGAGFRVDVGTTDPALRPAYETCPGSTIALTPSGSMLVGSASINASSPVLNRVSDVGTTCGSGTAPSGWTDIVTSFTLTSPRTVSVSVTPSSGSWFVEVDSSCSRSAHVSGCGIFSTSGALVPITPVALAAGTYFIVAETTMSPPGNLMINVTAM